MAPGMSDTTILKFLFRNRSEILIVYLIGQLWGKWMAGFSNKLKGKWLIGSLLIFLLGCGAQEGSQTDRTSLTTDSFHIKNNNFSTILSYPPDSFPSGRLTDTIPTHTGNFRFALYLPKSYSSKGSKKWPLLLCFDASGRALYPLKKYKVLADQYGIILAASWDSKNRQPIELSHQIASELISDLKSRLSIDPQLISTMGFSGGARVASSVAINLGGIHTVIACAGGFPQLTAPPKPTFGFAALIGNQDFNYLEIEQLHGQLQQLNFNQVLIGFDGEHEWAPVSSMEKAINFMLGKAMREQKIKAVPEILEKMDELNRQKPKPEGFEQLANEEIRLRQNYSQQMAQPLSWWNIEVAKLSQLSTQKPTWKGNAYRRVLNFLSLLCYMQCQQALQANDLDAAEKFVTLYQWVDPDYFEHQVFLASVKIRKNDTKGALTALEKALNLGLEEPDRLTKDPDFLILANQPRFLAVIKALEQK